MADFVNNIEFLQYKAPTDLPDVNSQYVNSAEEVNTCITQQIKNTIKLSGVELPSQSTRSDAIDPLFLAKTIQHYASFAQTYIVDVSSTENNIIITPSVNDIQLQTVLLESNGSEIVATTNNINGLVDAQVFDELPNGAIFQFIPLLSNTSSNINLTVRIKRLKWDIATLSQIVENKDFSYPIKDIDGITNLSANEIIGNKLIIVHFDSNNNVFKVVNKTIIASQTTAGISYLPKTIVLSNNISNPNTQLDYSAGTFKFSDESGSAIINSGTINFATNGANGLDVGVIASNATYHCFAIYNPTTKVSVGLASTSPTSPTLPSGYTKFRRVGSAITNASSQIYQGTWYADNKFELATPILSISNVSQLVNTENTRTILSPLGIRTEVFGSFKAVISGASSAANFKIYSGNITLPTLTAGDGQCYASAGVCNGQAPFSAKTNILSQVKTNRFNIVNNNAATISIAIDGWIDYTLND